MKDVERARDRILLAWSKSAARIVQDRLQDAAAHSSMGNTKVASDRLDELGDALSGKTAQSLNGLIHDAREAFYRSAFNLWEDKIPAAHRSEVIPHDAGARVARKSRLNGRDTWRDLQNVLIAAKSGLQSASTAASIVASRGAGNERSIYAAWQIRHTKAILDHVLAELSDAQIALFESVGKLMIREPEEQVR